MTLKEHRAKLRGIEADLGFYKDDAAGDLEAARKYIRDAMSRLTMVIVNQKAKRGTK